MRTRPAVVGPKDSEWWRHAVVYQVYPRSFADSNDDGIGDFRGVLAKVDHLETLGVDAVWFSPFYPSALSDGGYDVDDYRDVDPRIGSIADFDEVVGELHARGLRVIIDIVPNHSSDRHAWFREAVAAPAGSAARKRYHFRAGRGVDGRLPPNDWRSLFGGPAWSRVADGQWYLHMFTPAQPDWNWADAEVREDFLRTLRFWADHGVDGFRVDVAMMLAKDMSEPFPTWERVSANLPAPLGPGGASSFADGAHPLLDRDELSGIYAEWRAVFDSYDPPLFAVAETWVEPHRRTRYSSPGTLGQAFNFDLLWSPWDPAEFARIVRENLELAAASGSSSTWVLSNHDVVRHATRYAPSALPVEQRIMAATELDADAIATGLRRAKAATLLALALPGSAYLYQGEELGLPEVTGIPADRRQDPQAQVLGEVVSTRDGCRVPLPWTASGPFFGFSEGAAHLPQPGWFGRYAAAVQAGDDSSTLALYRRALGIRRRFPVAETLTWLDLGADVVGFRRPNGWTSITNFGDSPAPLPPGRILLSSVPGPEPTAVPAEATVWLLT
jgi:alpha-glucosidase